LVRIKMPIEKDKLLVIDDEPKMLQSLKILFEGEGYEVHLAESGAEGEKLFRQHSFTLVLTDLMMPDESGIEVLRALHQIDSEIPVIIMTAYGTVETAVEAIKLGAKDFLLKPFTLDEISLKVKRTLESSSLKRENTRLKEQLKTYEERWAHPVFASPVMEKIFKDAMDVAKSDLTVIVHGSSGVGKEIVARYMHFHSPRREKTFVVVNCTVLSEGLIESELFGHEKGAFTGAFRLKLGKCEVADGGTLFLDEIGELPASVQAKLLRFLQDHQFERVGGTKTLSSNVRVIAATNKKLEDEVANGKFREDLFYRISVIPIYVPPLCERRDDIEPLVDYFFQRAIQRQSSPVRTISRAALGCLTSYSWPGNVRELENAIERAVILGRKGELDVSDFDFLKVRKEVLAQDRDNDISLTRNEKRFIETALQRTRGNIVKAAHLLEISRTTLYSKIEKHGIDLRSYTGD
jgi:DNA-binding NtrC family response regulator